MNRNILQDDQHSETDEAGVVHHQRVYVEERWETFGPDGKTYCSEATREDALFRHVQGNGHLAAAAAEMAQHGQQSRVSGEPLCGVRKVVRYETNTVREVESDREELDELTVQLSLPPCTHPANRIMDSGSYYDPHKFCGRCCERMPSEGGT